MTVNFPGSGAGIPGANASGGRRAEAPAVNNNNSVRAPAEAKQAERAEPQVDLEAAEARRFERVEQAARQFFSDFFAVSDTTFSIYKDGQGQYITRFTSLRDGRTTYIPEPQLLRNFEARGGSDAIVQIEA